MEEVTETSPEKDDVLSTDEPVEAEASQAEELPEEEPEKAKADKEAAEKAFKARQKRREQKEREALIAERAALEEKVKLLETKPQDKAPKVEDFDDLDQYIEAKIKFETSKGKKEETQEIDPRYVQAVQTATEDLKYYGSELHEDFEDVVFDDRTPITPVMRDAIFGIGNEDPEVSANIAYYLGKNRKECARISRLDPMRQIAEIGKIEVKLSQTQTKRASDAPKPAKPVGGKKAQTNSLTDEMSIEEWAKKRRAEKYG